MYSLLFLIITLAILVVVHEYGHFWVARRCDVKVLKFSVGFGKPLWSRLGLDGTEYIVAAIPLGGYVKMLDEREGDVPEHEKHHAFNNKSLSVRTAIVAAGPIANLAFAVFAYWFIFVLVGVPGTRSLIDTVAPDSPAERANIMAGNEIKLINGKTTLAWSSVYRELSRLSEDGGVANITMAASDVNHLLYVPKRDENTALLQQLGLEPIQVELLPVLADITQSGAADKAGLISGDVIKTVDEHKIESWRDFVKCVQTNAGNTLKVVVQRDEQEKIILLTPRRGEDGAGKIGVKVDASQTPFPEHLRTVERYGLLDALGCAMVEVWSFSSATLKSIGGMLTGAVSSNNIGGPIAIAQYASASADSGIISFVSFLAMISISLGLLNLLPIPILDGGHLMFYFIEWIRGKPVSETMQMQGQKIGLFLLLMLMFLAFSNDLTRLFG